MNNTTTPSPPDFSEFFINEKIRLSLMVMTVLTGFLGNGLVVFLIMNMKTRRSNDHIFLLNLACSDFLNIAFDTGRFVAHLSFTGGPPMKTLMYCKIFWPLMSVPFCAGIFTITVMSLHRCWVIVNPFKPKIRLLWIRLCVLSTWIVAIVIYLPVTISAGIFKNGCGFPEWSPEGEKIFSVFTLIVEYPLPLLVIMIAYLKIGGFMRRHKFPQQQTHVFKGKTRRNPGKETRKDSIHMVKTVGAIVLLFVILLLPLQVAKVTYHFDFSKKNWVFALWDYGDVFSSMHSAINPYIYTLRTPECRNLILSWFSKRPSTKNNPKSIETKTTRRQMYDFAPKCVSNETELSIFNNGKSIEDLKLNEQEQDIYRLDD